jgi:GNAT superfamily N-acetyltransferase
MGRLTGEYRIRRVDHEDDDVAETLRDLHDQTFTDGTVKPLYEGRWWGHWWIAYFGKKPVAFIGLVPSNQGRRIGYLCRVGVIPYHRGYGLQKRMVRVIERHARRLGWRSIVTDTTHNPASANSFIACGYRTYMPAVPWSFAAAVYWRKKL